jgi:hypothetical protein
MEDKNLDRFLKRYKKALSKKEQFNELYRDALQYAAPYRENFDEHEQGEAKDGKGMVYDSTALDAMNKFASNLQSSLVPPMRTWSILTPGIQINKDDKLIKESIEKITEVVFSQIQNSNFDVQIAESFLDLAVGTGALLVQRGDSIYRPLIFNSVPLSEVILEQGANGSVGAKFRKYKIPAGVIEETWPDADIPKELADIIKDNPEKEVNIIEGTYADKIEVYNTTTNKKEQRDGYKYCIVVNNVYKIVERDEKTDPWVVFRWSVMPGETYGRGVLLFSLPDIKSLNKTKQLTFQAASIGIFGMYTVQDDGVINIENIKFGPGMMLPVESNSQTRGKTIEPLITNSRVDLSQIIIADLKQSIKDNMMVDPIGPIDLPVKTATEISIRQRDLAKRIGSAFGRLQFELISPLLTRVLDILDEWGLIELGDFRVDGNTIAIRHVSPLALAQSEEEYINLVRHAETLVGLFGPEMAMMLIKPEEFSRISSEKLNIPSSVSPSKKEIEAAKQALTQAMQQQQQVR